MSIHYGDFLKEVLREQKKNMKFTLEVQIDFRSYVSKIEEYILSLVNILGSW